MAVKIRLNRIGKKGCPYYRIVATDARNKRDGRFLDDLGTFDPNSYQLVQYHEEKIAKWLAVGAECTDAAEKIMKIALKKSRQAPQN